MPASYDLPSTLAILSRIRVDPTDRKPEETKR
jgi:hypothetical protein